MFQPFQNWGCPKRYHFNVVLTRFHYVKCHGAESLSICVKTAAALSTVCTLFVFLILATIETVTDRKSAFSLINFFAAQQQPDEPESFLPLDQFPLSFHWKQFVEKICSFKYLAEDWMNQNLKRF